MMEAEGHKWLTSDPLARHAKTRGVWGLVGAISVRDAYLMKRAHS